MPATVPDFRQRFFDPYDPWMGPSGIAIRDWFYRGRLIGKIAAAIVVGFDWLAPEAVRYCMRCRPRVYPITLSQLIQITPNIHRDQALRALLDCAVTDREQLGLSWGLGFPWMSKNGLYPPNLPFVTHTPYAMEALLFLARDREDSISRSTREHFEQTYHFLEALLVMHDDDNELALSYAPVTEPRVVINANAYASFAYAMHAAHNSNLTINDEACRKAVKLAQYVVSSQNDDGSWHYYADRETGNFIDCFHSCFVLKNLRKAGNLIPEIQNLAMDAVNRGKDFVDTSFFDPEARLVRRFVERDIRDPFVWDLYDQAEYLGILIDFEQLEKAEQFAHEVTDRFLAKGHWYSRIDFLGRCWGKDFGRWGIVPFLYQSARLQSALES